MCKWTYRSWPSAEVAPKSPPPPLCSSCEGVTLLRFLLTRLGPTVRGWGLEWLDFGETPVPALCRRFARRRRPNGHHPTVYNDRRSATMIYRDRKKIKNDRRTTKTTTTITIIAILNEGVKIGRRDDERR